MGNKDDSVNTDMTSDLSLPQSKSDVPMSSFKDIAMKIPEDDSNEDSVTLKSIKIFNPDQTRKSKPIDQSTPFHKDK